MINEKNLWPIYLAALSLIAIFVSFEFGVSYYDAKSREGNAEIINISGRQRMLSQRITLLSADLLSQDNTEAEKQALTTRLHEARALFKNSHEGLIYKNKYTKTYAPAGEIANDIYFQDPHQLNAQMYKYLQLADKILFYPNLEEKKRALKTMKTMAYDPLLKALNLVVKRIEHHDKQQHERSEKLKLIFYLIALSVLVLEALIIFRPTHTYITKAFKDRKMFSKERMQAIKMTQLFALGDMAKETALNIEDTLSKLEVNLKKIDQITSNTIDPNAIPTLITHTKSGHKKIRDIVEELKQYSISTRMTDLEAVQSDKIIKQAIQTLRASGTIKETALDVKDLSEAPILCLPFELEQAIILLLNHMHDTALSTQGAQKITVQSHVENNTIAIKIQTPNNINETDKIIDQKNHTHPTKIVENIVQRLHGELNRTIKDDQLTYIIRLNIYEG